MIKNRIKRHSIINIKRKITLRDLMPVNIDENEFSLKESIVLEEENDLQNETNFLNSNI